MVNWFDIGLMIGLIIVMCSVKKLVIKLFVISNQNEKEKIGLMIGLMLHVGLFWA